MPAAIIKPCSTAAALEQAKLCLAKAGADLDRAAWGQRGRARAHHTHLSDIVRHLTEKQEAARHG